MLPHRYHFLILLHDCGMTLLAWSLSIIMRYNWSLGVDVEPLSWAALPVVFTIQVVIFIYLGLYRSLWRFTSMPDFSRIVQAAVWGTLVSMLVLVVANRLEGIPRSSLLIYPFLLIFLLGMPRLALRWLAERSLPSPHEPPRQRLLILGAGTSGDMLVRDMLRHPALGYLPLAFLDDNPALQGRQVQGIPIVGVLAELPAIVAEWDIHLVVIAMPSASDAQMQRVVSLCEQTHVPFLTLPKLDSLVRGQVNVHALRDVQIEDLLGRAKVQLDVGLLATCLRGKTVLVTGGGGSIGSELCRQIALLQPCALVIVDQSEFNLYHIDYQLKQDFPDLVLYPCLGDVADAVAMAYLFKRYAPQVVFHAAAYKHVPLLQTQTREAVRNNVVGTWLVAQAAMAAGCECMVLISTDKAVNPSNLMGATKRVAEMCCQYLNGQGKTRFITVRFGNVLGSAGSVVPLFQAQIAKGGPVTVTHPEMTRYFMTIPEACQLILQASALGRGGEIFVLDMGTPVRIRYLAEQMIRLAGKVPERDIAIVYSGLRAGEKLHEELFYAEEAHVRTEHEKIFLATQMMSVAGEALEGAIVQLQAGCACYAETDLVEVMQGLVPFSASK